jgi:hypothetical protein
MIKSEKLTLPGRPAFPISGPQKFFKKFPEALAFSKTVINNMVARTFSLSTCKKGYGETAVRPHPNEGRVALRTGLHGHLLWP